MCFVVVEVVEVVVVSVAEFAESGQRAKCHRNLSAHALLYGESVKFL